MKALDYILDGFEKALQLERELGVKSVECDLALLKKAALSVVPAPAPSLPATAAEAVRAENPKRAAAPAPSPSAPAGRYDFVFLHDRPLSSGGVEMMAKIIGAMQSSVESSPIIVAGPPPPAKVYIVLGGNALKKYFPGVKGAPGQWLKTDAADVLVTNSPEYILRFGAGNAAVQKIKQDMWRSLKTVRQRLTV